MTDTWTSSSPYSLELLADYVEGLLDPSTTARVTEHLAEHATDANVVEGIRAYLDREGATREGLETWLRESYARQEGERLQQKTNVRIRQWYYAAAAVALLGVVGWWLWQQTTSPQNWEQQATAWLQEAPYPEPTVTRSNPTTDTAALRAQRAAQAYQQGNWQRATEAYAQLAYDFPQYDTLTVQFYGAVAAVHADQATAQTEQRLQALAEGESSFRAGAAYYLVIVALQQGQLEQAKNLAQQALQEPNVYRRAVLEEIAQE